MNDNHSASSQEQIAAMQKLWLETASRIMQACTLSTNSAPPEFLRQVRSGILQALEGSWEQFLRSPQFLEGMKEWMDQATTFRKTNNDLLGRVRHELQAPSRDDIDTIMLAVRHVEKRVLDRLEQLSLQIEELKRSARAEPLKSAPHRASQGRKARRSPAPQTRMMQPEQPGSL